MLKTKFLISWSRTGLLLALLAIAPSHVSWAEEDPEVSGELSQELPQIKEETEAYCDYLDEKANAESRVDRLPSVIGAYSTGGAANDDSPTLKSNTSYRRTKFGVEYDLVNIPKSFLNGKLAQSSCEVGRARAVANLASRRGNIDEALLLAQAKRAAIAEKHSVLTRGLPALERAVSTFSQSMKRGSTTLFELHSVRESFVAIRLQIHETKAEMEKTVAEENALKSQLETVRKVMGDAAEGSRRSSDIQVQLNNAQMREMELRRQRDAYKNYELTLAGGYENISYANPAKTGGSSPYVAVTLKLNLGGVANSINSGEGRAADQWLQSRRTLGGSRGQSSALKTRLESLQLRQPIIETRFNEMRDLVGVAGVNASSLTSVSAVKLYGTYLLAQAEAAQMQAELRALRESGVEIALKPDATPAPHAIEPAPVASTPSFIRTNANNFRRPQPAENANQANLYFKIIEKMADPKALGSGVIRHQLGIMLRQNNQCNLVYVMIRLGDKPAIAVQEKVNAGQTTHQACENNGYRTIPGKAVDSLPSLQFGKLYRLQARIEGNALEVFFNQELVWRGNAPQSILSGKQIGFRSDNLVVEYQLSDILTQGDEESE